MQATRKPKVSAHDESETQQQDKGGRRDEQGASGHRRRLAEARCHNRRTAPPVMAVPRAGDRARVEHGRRAASAVSPTTAAALSDDDGPRPTDGPAASATASCISPRYPCMRAVPVASNDKDSCED